MDLDACTGSDHAYECRSSAAGINWNLGVRVDHAFTSYPQKAAHILLEETEFLLPVINAVVLRQRK